MRPPAHAGSFYPSDRAGLGDLVDRLLAEAAGDLPHVDPDAVVGVVVPHAGLDYSGPIAALGWTLGGKVRPTTIVLAGTDHRGSAPGVAVWTAGPWLHPLGETRIDTRLAVRIAALGPPFVADERAHLGEHSLEVQLPFIARACPGAAIVPLLVGGRALASTKDAGAGLGRLLTDVRTTGERVLLVASSDFAHYPPARVAREITRRMLDPILRLDEIELGRREAEVRRSGSADCGMCGIDPVRFVLTAVRKMGATGGTLLGEGTSADAEAGDPTSTVGYAAVALHA